MPDNETKKGSANAPDGSVVPDPSQNKLLEFIRGVDLLMMDCQYTPEEYQAHVGWGHGCIDEVVRMAIKAEVKRLFTFHHDPSHSDEAVAAMLASAKAIATAAGSSIMVEAAREGAEVTLRTGVAATAAAA
jgi:phosphoribosyl 1,2-cyclic phosphodiesterase